MNVKIAALVAEIASTIDGALLAHDHTFGILSRPHRLSMIMVALQRHGFAEAEMTRKDLVSRWGPSERLKKYPGVQQVGIPDAYENIECPLGTFSVADEITRMLRSSVYMIEEAVNSGVRRFQMCGLDLLEYRGRVNGLCVFRKSPRCIEAMRKDDDVRGTFEKYLDPQRRTGA